MGTRISGFGPCLDGLYDPSLQLQMNAYTRTAELIARGRAANDQLRTPEDVRARKTQLQDYANALVGTLPADRPAPEVTVSGAVYRAAYTIEKLVLETDAHRYVTGTLYVPRDLEAPTGAVLFLCGHAESGKAAPLYQAMCGRLARNGLVVLAIDSIGHGERKSYLDSAGRELVGHNVIEHNHAGMQCWWIGDTIARYFVEDARRSIDYLCARSEVDPARIGVGGNSGGGTQTTWLMLSEPRIAAAAPSCVIMSRASYQWAGGAQDAEQIFPSGALTGIDHEDFLIAMAPRPVLVMSANYDFFPIEGAVDTVDRARRAYRILGNPDGLGHARTDHQHGLHPDLALAATEFFVRELGNRPDRQVDYTDPEPVAESDLLCTKSGHIVLDHPRTRLVFDINRERYGLLRSSRKSDPTAWLTTAIHAHRRVPAEFFPRWQSPEEHNAGSAELVSRRVFWWSETDVINAGVFVFAPRIAMSAVEIALFESGTAELSDRTDWLAERAEAGIGVLVMDVRGIGALSPHPINEFPLEENYGTIYKLMTDLIWMGDSLAAARIFDILRAVAFVRQDNEINLGSRPIRLFGAGQGAFHGYLAAAVERGIVSVELESPPFDPEAIVGNRFHGPQSHWQYLIPGMAVHCTLDDLLPNFDSRELHIHRPRV